MELRIKELIKEKGTTIQNIADLIGVNRVTLSNSINGNPTLETLEKIANALGVPVAELFDKSSDEVVGAVRIGKDTHVINSKEDIRKLAKNL
ncbi:XRE family transcriptional regulator [Parabacteroides goldsteinii]|uniref:XRE family transcriptional regulator n=1 Tax=Parabacteroides goldsteinii TaxID=328812 RepID=A0A0J6FB75_9BACT|nr:helix-turn-helix transcriptional regulator [Parabacteroides goldsteinii]KMM31952.1 XRE family transcriptional regulator [Parabacteroides goldsteinii]